ncbi:Cytochrome P450 - like 10 [Theobroma cacao]|nr:Cytochrome P450 - like 10 [Theobroma cacao]
MLVFSVSEWVSSHLTLWDVAIALLGLFIFSCIHESLANKGPMLWPVLGVIPSVLLHMNDIYDWATRALINAGGTFPYRGMWMGGSYGIITVDPSNIEYMLKTNFKNFPKGKYYRERFCDLLGGGIFNSDDESWKEQRQLAKLEMHSSRFIEHSIQSMQDIVHQKLMNLLEKLANSGHCFDLQEVFLRLTFDNICTAALGIDPGCLALDLREVPFAKAFEDATELTLLRFLMPPFVWKPLKFFRLGNEKRLKEAIEVVHDFADKTVRDRRKKLDNLGNLNDHSDLLSRLMEKEIDKQGKNRQYPGRDTTSVALAWFFWLVHKNPEVESKILGEIYEILSHPERRTEDDDIVFTIEELKKMVYLEAALSESLRLHPSVPIEMKQVLEDDVFPDGTRVKKGARVLHCIFSMARIDSIWGKDCLEFKPERWIKDGKFVSANQFKYAVFNAGPRLCVGKKFAYTQMKMVAASVLLRYSVKVVEGHSVVPKVTTTLYMKNGLMVTLKPSKITKKKMSKTIVELPPKGSFSFDLCRRNEMFSKKEGEPSIFSKDWNYNCWSYFSAINITFPTYINGMLMSAAIILRADTRATAECIVCDKNCVKIHSIAPNIYCCGAGTATDTEVVTVVYVSIKFVFVFTLPFHQRHGQLPAAATSVSYWTRIKDHNSLDSFKISSFPIYPHGSMDILPFATMGSGSLAAMTVFESKYHEGLTKEEGFNLVCKAICAGIFNDLGSGSNVDVCVITKGRKEYLRNYQVPNHYADNSSK